MSHPLLAAIAALGTLALAPATAAAATPRVELRGWTVTRINQETERVPPGGAVLACRAIPAIAIAPRLRWRGARPGIRVRLRLRVPGHAPRTRWVRLPRRSGRTAVTYTPRDERLRDEAFPPGIYRLTVSRSGRVLARGTLELAGGSTC